MLQFSDEKAKPGHVSAPRQAGLHAVFEEMVERGPENVAVETGKLHDDGDDEAFWDLLESAPFELSWKPSEILLGTLSGPLWRPPLRPTNGTQKYICP